MRAVDITGIELVSRLKFLLIGDRALTDAVTYRAILGLVRATLRKPAAELCIIAYWRDQLILLQQEPSTAGSALALRNLGSRESFEGTLYGRTGEENRPMARDLSANEQDPHLKNLFEGGTRSVLTIPLSNGAVPSGHGGAFQPRPDRGQPGGPRHAFGDPPSVGAGSDQIL